MSVLCIVPAPLAAARASRRLCRARGGVLFGLSVTTLDRGAAEVLVAAGDSRPVLSPLAERLLAVRAGREAGGPFADVAPDDGLAGSLASALGELRRGEVDSSTVGSVAKGLGGGAGSRLALIARALGAYESALRDLSALDRAGATRCAASAARRGSLPAEMREIDLLAVDGLFEASRAEWDLLSTIIARARRARIHVPFFPERPDVCAPAESLLRRVEGLHELHAQCDMEVVLPRIDGEGRLPKIAALLGAFARGRAAGGRAHAATAEGLVLAEPGPGGRGEVRAAARAIVRLLDMGLLPEEIAVIAPSPRSSAPALAAACAEAGIPFAGGRGRRLAESPPVRAVLDALDAACELDRTGAERLATSTYLAPGLPAAMGALLDRAGAIDGRMTPGEALRRRAEALTAGAAKLERAALEQAARGLDSLAKLIRPLGSSGTPREHAARIATFAGTAGIRRRAARGPAEVASRDLAALAAFDDVLEELARALTLVGRGADRIGPAELRALVALAVDGAVVPPPLEPAAGAVELWGLKEAPGLSSRAAILTGCVRGGFPAPLRADPLLEEPERQAINSAERRAALEVAAARRSKAIFHAFSAAAAAREAAIFIWPARGPGGDGGPLAPMVEDALVAIGERAAGPAPEPPLPRARTVGDALRAAARIGRAAFSALETTPLASRAKQAIVRGEIEAERREAVRERRASTHAGSLTGPALAAFRAALPDEWAPTQLERWAVCPFRFLLETGARLSEPRDEGLDIESRDEGGLLHEALERFVRARIARGAWPPSGADSDIEEARATAGDVLYEFERTGRTGDPAVWAARREAVLGRLDRFVRSEAKGPRDLTPVLLEHGFGGSHEFPPLELAWMGEVVRLRGRMDRVDAGPDRLLVIDYKTRGSKLQEKLDPDSFGTTSFQIPAYMLAAARDLPGRSRIGATYEVLRTAKRLEAVELDRADPRLATGEVASIRSASAAAPLQVKRRSPAEREGPVGEAEGGTFASGVASAIESIRDGELPIASRSCTHCPFGAVCRFEGVAAREDEDRA